MTNEDLVKLSKAGIVTDLGGQLSTEQLASFVDTTVEDSEFLKECRTESGIRGSRELEAIGLGTRVMTLNTEREEVAEDDKVVPDFDKHVLTPKHCKVAFDISFDMLFKNIEKEKLEGHINTIAQTQIDNDTVDVAFNGDTASAVKTLKITDGYIKRALADAAVHKDVYTDADKLKDVFSAMWKKLPDKWKRMKKDFRFYVAPSVEQEYRDQLSEKNADAALNLVMQGGDVLYNGILVKPLFAMPPTKIMLTKPMNLAVGFGDQLRVGRFVNERKGQVEYTLRPWVDAHYVLSDLLVLFSQN